MTPTARVRFARAAAALLAAAALAGCPEQKRDSSSSSSSSSSSGGSSSDDYAGEHRGKELSIKLERSGSGYKGTIQRGDKTFPLEAEVKGGVLQGSFHSGEAKFPFELKRDGEASLDLKTGERVYKLAAQPRPKNPLGDGPADGPAGDKPAKNPLDEPGEVAQGPKDPQDPKGGWEDPKAPKRGAMKPTDPDGERRDEGTPTTSAPPPPARPPEPTPRPPADEPLVPSGWKNASAQGATLHYPPDWQLNAVGNDVVQLIPADVQKDAQGGHEELYFVRGIPAQGVARADDPRVAPWMDGVIQQQVPFLSRQGEPKKMGQSVLLVYGGTGPNGKRVEARCYAKIVDGVGFTVLALGLPEPLAKRAQTLERIALAFAYKRPPNDARLVGQWRHTGGTITKDFNTVSERYLLLRADGRCFSSGRFMAGHTSRNQLGDATGRTLVDSGETGGWEKQGTWSGPVGGGLTLTWSDGSSESWGSIDVASQMLLFKAHAQAKKGTLYERTK